MKPKTIKIKNNLKCHYNFIFIMVIIIFINKKSYTQEIENKILIIDSNNFQKSKNLDTILNISSNKLKSGKNKNNSITKESNVKNDSIIIPNNLKSNIENYYFNKNNKNSKSENKVENTNVKDSTLKEVVVVGYGSTKIKDATGSLSSINVKDFNSGAITSPEGLLVGKVAGVNITQGSGAPGSAPTIRIRGTSSLVASNDPLIVIDDIPVDNGGVQGISNPLSMINPNDIENMVILKDASSTAIYGSRASNGVILITTKKGSGNMKISFNTNLSIGTIYNSIESLSSREFKDILYNKGSITQTSLIGKTITNWQQPLYQNSIGTDNNISVSGNDLHKKITKYIKSMPYRFSLGYNNQSGILKTNTFERYTTGISLIPTFNKINLKLDINIKGSYVANRFADESVIKDAITFDPTQNILDTSNKYKRYGGYFEWLNADGSLNALAPKNPISKLINVYNTSVVTRWISNVKFEYTVHHLKELKAILNLGYDIQYSNGTNKADTFVAVTNGKGRNDQYSQKKTNSVLDFYLNYNKTFNDIFGIDASSGYSYQKFYSENYSKSQNLKDSLVVEGIGSSVNLLVSYWGRLNLKFFDGRYLLTGSIRADGSSRFSESNRFGYFPSLAFAWNLEEEKFMNFSKNYLNKFKLRFSWGLTGQQDIGDFQYLPTYTISTNSASYQLGDSFYNTYKPGAYNSNIKWEQTSTLNFGLDYSFLNNRFFGTIDYYIKTTTDLLNSVYIPAGSNLSNKIVANIGSMENKGLEIMLNTIAIKNKILTWQIGLNLTYNQNIISKITLNNNPYFRGVQQGGISGALGNTIQINSTGYAVNSFYVYKQIYDVNGKPIENLYYDIDKNGVINDLDFIRYKNPNATYLLGFNSTIAAYNFDLNFSLRTSLGNFIYDNVNSEKGNLSFLNQSGFLTSATKDALNTNFINMQAYSDYYIKDASFLRIDNISLGYNLIILKKLKCRISSSITNVLVLTQYKGLDPEISNGIDNTIYPRPRTYTFGIKLDF